MIVIQMIQLVGQEERHDHLIGHVYEDDLVEFKGTYGKKMRGKK